MSHRATGVLARPAGVTWEDRRAAVRFCCKLGTACRPISSLREHQWQGTVVNVSTDGLGLLLGRRFEAGTLLAVELQTPAGEPAGTVIARVAHNTQQGAEWLVGCDFLNPLPEDDLRALVPEAF
jgi:hypothetical protein